MPHPTTAVATCIGVEWTPSRRKDTILDTNTCPAHCLKKGTTLACKANRLFTPLYTLLVARTSSEFREGGKPGGQEEGVAIARARVADAVSNRGLFERNKVHRDFCLEGRLVGG